MSLSLRVWSRTGLYPDQSLVNLTLNLVPLLCGGRTNLKAGEEDLVPVLPHDEGGDGAHESLEQVQYDLEQEVEGERPSDRLAAGDLLVGEGAGDWVVWLQSAHAVPSHLLTAEAAGLWVVVYSKGHDQHWNDQADGAQGKVEELERAEEKRHVHIYVSVLHKLSSCLVCSLVINPESQNCSLETSWLGAHGRFNTERLPTTLPSTVWPSEEEPSADAAHVRCPAATGASHLESNILWVRLKILY